MESLNKIVKEYWSQEVADKKALDRKNLNAKLQIKDKILKQEHIDIITLALSDEATPEEKARFDVNFIPSKRQNDDIKSAAKKFFYVDVVFDIDGMRHTSPVFIIKNASAFKMSDVYPPKKKVTLKVSEDNETVFLIAKIVNLMKEKLYNFARNLDCLSDIKDEDLKKKTHVSVRMDDKINLVRINLPCYKGEDDETYADFVYYEPKNVDEHKELEGSEESEDSNHTPRNIIM